MVIFKKRKIVSLLMTLVMALSMVFVIAANPNTEVSAAASGTGMYITTSNLNLRSGAGTGYSILVTIPQGKYVSVTAVSGSWGKTTYSGKTGWIHLGYATKYTTTVATITGTNVNLRSGPSTGYSSYGKMTKGSLFTYNYKGTTWTYGYSASLRKYGYVHNSYLSK